MRRRLGLVALGAVAVFLLLPALAVGVSGLRSSGDEEEAERPSPAVVEEPARPIRRTVDLVIDTTPADPRAFAGPPAVLDRLSDGDTRLLQIVTPTDLLVGQCSLDTLGQPLTCRPGVPAAPAMETDVATVLVDMSARLGDGTERADCRTVRCALVITTDDGEDARRVAVVDLVFGGAAGRPAVEVAVDRPVTAGDRVTVRLHGFAPGAPATLTWCRVPGPLEVGAPGAAKRCGGPADETTVNVDGGGRAEATLEVPSRAGRDGRCSSRRPCAVAAIASGLPAAVVPVSYAGAPGPDLPMSRVLVGVGLAAVLLAAAVVLARRSGDDQPIDPFAGVTLAVPEWDGVEIGGDPEWEEEPLIS